MPRPSIFLVLPVFALQLFSTSPAFSADSGAEAASEAAEAENSGNWSDGSNIHMLPPYDRGTARGCHAGEGNKLLTWDGATSIKCNKELVVRSNGNVGIRTASPETTLDVAGGVKVGTTTTPCVSALQGTLRYNPSTKSMQLCDGAAWGPLSKITTRQVHCSSRHAPEEGAEGDYSCTATCEDDEVVTGGGFDWGAVYSQAGRDLYQLGNGYHCVINVSSCSSNGPSCASGCFATCAKVQ